MLPCSRREQFRNYRVAPLLNSKQAVEARGPARAARTAYIRSRHRVCSTLLSLRNHVPTPHSYVSVYPADNSLDRVYGLKRQYMSTITTGTPIVSLALWQRL